MSNKENVTTDDLAQAAGVSRYTVSRVLNNRGGVAQKTVDLIRRTMEEIGYAPPPEESRRGPKPKSQNPDRSDLVLFAAFGLEDAVLRSNFYHELSFAVEQTLARQGRGMVIQRFLPGFDLPLNLSNVDGAVFIGEPPPEIHDQTKPVVQVLGVVGEQESWDHVSYDGYRIGVLAANYLTESGHQHMALFQEGGGRARNQGFIDTLCEKGMEPLVLSEGGPLYLKSEIIHEIDLDALNARLDTLLAAEPRPTGVFVETDMITISLYSALYARGIVPGKDLDIISCNNERALLAPLIPRPPSVDLHVRWMGETAVDRLLYRMEHPTEPVSQIVCKPFLPPAYIPSVPYEAFQKTVLAVNSMFEG
jgi:LacI family transcriptional regulator